MDDATEKLLDRVRKLLALATSPNVHEAAAAAVRAQALVERHRLHALLDEAPDADPVDDGRDEPLEVSRRLRRWKVYLAAGLADVNGCVAYTARAGREDVLLLAGRPADRAAVRALWGWLVHRIELCSATEGPGRDRAWHEAFRVGAAETVCARLARSGDEVRAELDTTALARVDAALAGRRDAVDRFVRDNLRLGRGRGLRVDARAYARGREAGETLSLSPDAPRSR